VVKYIEIGQPWYMPATWPIGHVAATISKPNDEKPPTLTTTPLMGTIDVLTAFAAGLRNYILACFCIYYLYPNTAYPGLTDEAKTPFLGLTGLLYKILHLNYFLRRVSYHYKA